MRDMWSDAACLWTLSPRPISFFPTVKFAELGEAGIVLMDTLETAAPLYARM